MYEITPEVKRSRVALERALLCFYMNTKVNHELPAFMQWDKCVPDRVKEDLKDLKSEYISNVRITETVILS